METLNTGQGASRAICAVEIPPAAGGRRTADFFRLLAPPLLICAAAVIGRFHNAEASFGLSGDVVAGWRAFLL
jgi:hypothetical protein